MQELLRLRRFLEMPAADPVPPAERCELCSAELPPEHSHIVDVEARRLLCACRPCFLLFTDPSAANGKYRSAGARYEQIDAAQLAWDAFDLPIGMAFFLRSTAANRVMAFYPSPAGATESALAMDVPVMNRIEPDVEALLVYRSGHSTEAWIVPVDACYELVGRIRRCWRGFDGGPEAHQQIEEFFGRLESQRSAACPP